MKRLKLMLASCMSVWAQFPEILPAVKARSSDPCSVLCTPAQRSVSTLLVSGDRSRFTWCPLMSLTHGCRREISAPAPRVRSYSLRAGDVSLELGSTSNIPTSLILLHHHPQ